MIQMGLTCIPLIPICHFTCLVSGDVNILSYFIGTGHVHSRLSMKVVERLPFTFPFPCSVNLPYFVVGRDMDCIHLFLFFNLDKNVD